MNIKKISLTYQIFISLVLAIFVGLLMQTNSSITVNYIKPFGVIFLNLLKFIVVPIVLFSMMQGIISMRDIRKVGSIGLKSVLFFAVTTVVAAIIGISGGAIFKDFFPVISVSSFKYEASSNVNFFDILVDIFPSNFVWPMLNSSMLQIIFISVLIGFSVILAGEKSKVFVGMIESCNVVFTKCMEIILKLSPIGVFCLLCPVVASSGASIVGSLAIVLLAAYICYALHTLIVYSIAVKFLGNMNPLDFFREQLPTILFAFSSASSVGTIPINLNGCKKMGISQDISSFVISLGATINMNGTTIYQGICTTFIASCYGIDLTLPQIITIIVTATLSSIGTAGIPGAGTIMLTMVLTSVGLPAEGIAIVMGVDRIFDMGRTVVNTTGDTVCALVVSNSEKRKL